MTLTSTTTKIVYAGDGSTVLFSVPFVFWDDDDLTLVLTDSSGAETTWTRGTQYTVTGGDGANGSITVISTPTDYTPASGETLTIKSNVPLTQDTSLPEGGAFPSSSVEQELDQVIRRLQQIKEEVDRSLKITFVDDNNSVSDGLPSVSGNAGEYLRVKSDESGFEWAEVSQTSAAASDATPQATSISTGSAGTGTNFARDDHSHQTHQGARTAERLAKYHYGGL